MGRIAGVTAEDTRQRLLESAAAEFDRRGFEGARVADIASGADLSNGALYGHFRSKSDLLSAALTERGGADLATLFEGIDGRSIAALLVAIGRRPERLPPRGAGLMVEALVAARRDPEVAEVSGRHLAEVETLLAGLIGDGQAEGTIDEQVDPAALARFCVMLVLGATLLSPASPAGPATLPAGVPAATLPAGVPALPATLPADVPAADVPAPDVPAATLPADVPAPGWADIIDRVARAVTTSG